MIWSKTSEKSVTVTAMQVRLFERHPVLTTTGEAYEAYVHPVIAMFPMDSLQEAKYVRLCIEQMPRSDNELESCIV